MELKYHIQISSHQHFSIGNNQLKTACLQLNVCIFCLRKATDERAGYKQMTSQEIGLYIPDYLSNEGSTIFIALLIQKI